MACYLALSIAKARLTAGKLADLLTPEQTRAVVELYARQNLGVTYPTGSTYGAAVTVTAGGITIMVSGSRVTVEASDQELADTIAAEVGALLTAAGRTVVANSVAAALRPMGQVEINDLSAEQEGQIQTVSRVRLTF